MKKEEISEIVSDSLEHDRSSKKKKKKKKKKKYGCNHQTSKQPIESDSRSDGTIMSSLNRLIVM